MEKGVRTKASARKKKIYELHKKIATTSLIYTAPNPEVF